MLADGDPVRKIVIGAALHNASLRPVRRGSRRLDSGRRRRSADEFGRRIREAIGNAQVASYGKACLVGTAGEYEHGNALLTTVFADPVRSAIGGAKAWIPSTGKRGAPGASIDIPLAHKDELYVRSHYDTVSAMFADAPAADEIVIAFAFATRGRLHCPARRACRAAEEQSRHDRNGDERSYTGTGAGDGLSLRVLEWGPQTAPPVVMLHGIRGYAQTFATLAAALAPGFRTIAYDQRGRGESDWDPARQYYNDTYVRDLEDVVRELRPGALRSARPFDGRHRRLCLRGRPSRPCPTAGHRGCRPGRFEDSAGSARIRQELLSAPSSFESWDAAVEFMRKLRPTVTEAARQERLRNMLKQRADGTWTWQYDHAGIAEARLIRTRPASSICGRMWRQSRRRRSFCAAGAPTISSATSPRR